MASADGADAVLGSDFTMAADAAGVAATGIPWGTVINAVAQVATPAPMAPAGLNSAFWSRQTFDNSGWTVATGKSEASGGNGLKLPSMPKWGLIGLGALGLIVWMKIRIKK